MPLHGALSKLVTPLDMLKPVAVDVQNLVLELHVQCF